jgi:beta-glucosidase/6-phospho-beta-glucosidase/beta-galactosidase
MNWRLAPTCNPGETMTDMPYAVYPAGLSIALQGASALGVPLYITETGIADAGDARRALMVDSYMAEVRRWTLCLMRHPKQSRLYMAEV